MADSIFTRHLIVQTPFGDVVVVYRENPFLILEVVLPRPAGETPCRGASIKDFGAPGEHDKARLIGQSIRDYFGGKPLLTPWPWLGIGVFTGMQQSVLKAVSSIPYGRLSSYRRVAESIGRPMACRAVGTALAKNPFPLLIPCHRVIRSDGSLGLFGGGADLKLKLITLEARNSATDFDSIHSRKIILTPDYQPATVIPSSPVD